MSHPPSAWNDTRTRRLGALAYTSALGVIEDRRLAVLIARSVLRGCGAYAHAEDRSLKGTVALVYRRAIDASLDALEDRPGARPIAGGWTSDPTSRLFHRPTVRWLLLRLPSAFRAVFWMYHGDQMSLGEIAHVTGSSEAEVGRMLKSARHKALRLADFDTPATPALPSALCFVAGTNARRGSGPTLVLLP